jgi:hypothetical protein
MRIWFDGEKDNPNDKVAKLNDQQLMGMVKQELNGKAVLSQI